MKLMKPLAILSASAALVLTGCVTDPTTGQQHVSKTAMYAWVLLQHAAS